MGDFKYLRSYLTFSTWARNISSDISFDSSEVSFLPYVGIFLSPREHSQISTWITAFSDDLCPPLYKRICDTARRAKQKGCSFRRATRTAGSRAFREDYHNSDIIVIFARDSCEPLLALEGLGATHTYV